MIGVMFEPGLEPPRLFHCCRPPNGLPVLYSEITVIGTESRLAFVALACSNHSCPRMPGLGLSLREFVRMRHEVEELRMLSSESCLPREFSLGDLSMSFDLVALAEPERRGSWKEFVRAFDRGHAEHVLARARMHAQQHTAHAPVHV